MKEYEIYCNGRHEYHIIGDKEFEMKCIDISKELENKGFVGVDYGDDYSVFVNHEEGIAYYYKFRCFIGFKDCKGLKIFEDSILENKYGDEVGITMIENVTESGETTCKYYYRVFGTTQLIEFTDNDFLIEEGVHVVNIS